jgi:hypothetical protein
MAMDLSTKTDQELNNLIDNHRRKRLLRAPLYLEVLTERVRRRENGLEFVKSVRIILEAAREGRCVSYKQLAEASGDIGTDHDAFLEAEQTRVFDFAREHPEL